MPDRTRLRSAEHEALLSLFAMFTMSKNDIAPLMGRISSINGGKRDIGCIQSKTRRMTEEILRTADIPQMKNIEREISNIRYHVGVKNISGVSSGNPDGIWLDFKTINTIFQFLGENCCMLCTKNKDEQRRCALQKALDVIPTDAEDKGAACKYFGETWKI